MRHPLQCHGCRHYEWGTLDRDRCAAFPDGVPDEIWLGDADHAQPFSGDGGVRRQRLEQSSGADGVRLRHDAWKKRPVERLAHEADPLGALVAQARPALAAMVGDSVDELLEAATLRVAWLATEDAPAMLLVLLTAGRIAELARAVRLTSNQLGLEGCDYLDNPGWLTVSLCLAAYENEDALTNTSAAWSALSSPFRDGYLTTRVQQTLLRSMRRVVPEPPPVREWTFHEGVGPLADGIVAMRPVPIRRAGK